MLMISLNFHFGETGRLLTVYWIIYACFHINVKRIKFNSYSVCQIPRFVATKNDRLRKIAQ
jgi:hypothetical protein